MDDPKIFFSYSRDDSKFVQDLAQKLRSAGAHLWLDQLDIPAGKLWDRAIEEALEASECLLVILSPTSVDSNNVMDEVSYALEEGKRVIPVLYQKCKIPFRLRRVQYIDFTGGFDTGFTQLLSALNIEDSSRKGEPGQPLQQPDNGKQDASDVTASSEATDLGEKRRAEENPHIQASPLLEQTRPTGNAAALEAPIQSSKVADPEKKPLPRKAIIIALAALLVIAAGVIIFAMMNQSARRPELGNVAGGESSDWEKIKDSANPDDFKSFLLKYPAGAFVALAKDKLARLESPPKPAPPRPVTREAVAAQKEREGFESLIAGNYDDAITAFRASENAFHSYHQVYELARLVRRRKAELTNPDKRKELFRLIVTDYSFGAPPDLLSRLKELSQ